MDKRIALLTLTLTLSLISPLFAEEEEFVITTYYPSPYGVYKNLRIYPNDDSMPGGACTNNGEMYYDNSEQNLYICSSGVWKLVPGRDGIPSGMIAMFATSCPTGWTRFTALDGRFPMGATTYGTSGGSTAHTQTYSGTTATAVAPSGDVTVPGTCCMGVYVGLSVHAHTYSGATSAADHTPPYITVIWCKKN